MTSFCHLFRRRNPSATLERHDSIVTDSLLQMTSFTPSAPSTTAAAEVAAKTEDALEVSQPTSESGSPRQEGQQAKEDMDMVRYIYILERLRVPASLSNTWMRNK